MKLNDIFKLNFINDLIKEQGEGNYLIIGADERYAKYFMIRIKKIRGIEYILCPVPLLFDEESEVEVGFALDLDEDHFDVYAYEHNYKDNETRVLRKLPHCVHKAVTYNIEDMDLDDEQITEMSNIESAKLFINHYLIDQLSSLPNSKMELNPMFEIFDNKLYQQLVNRLANYGDNKKVVELRYKFLLDNFKYLEDLDENDPSYEMYLEKAVVHLMNFLFGCEDIMDNKGFRDMVNKEWIVPYIQIIYLYLFKNRKISNARNLYEWCQIKPDLDPKLVQEYYSELFRKKKIKKGIEMYEWCQIKPDFNPERVQEYYSKLFKQQYISEARELYNWCNVVPYFEPKFVKNVYSELIKAGKLYSTLILCEWSGIELDFNPERVQEYYSKLFKDGKIQAAENLYKWSMIEPDFNPERVQEYYSKLFKDGKIQAVQDLYEWCKIKLDNEIIQTYYSYLLYNGYIASAQFLYDVFKILPNPKLVQETYSNLLRNKYINTAQLLFDCCKIPPNSEILQETYSRLFREGYIEEAQYLNEWSKVGPDFGAENVHEYYTELFKKGYIKEAKQLYTWCKIEPELKIIQNYYSENFDCSTDFDN